MPRVMLKQPAIWYAIAFLVITLCMHSVDSAVVRSKRKRSYSQLSRRPRVFDASKADATKEELAEFWGLPRDTKFPIQPDRVYNISKEKFSDYVRMGRPVVITDMLEKHGDWPMFKKWKCDWVHKQWGKAEARLNRDPTHDPNKAQGVVSLCDNSCSAKTTSPHNVQDDYDVPYFLPNTTRNHHLIKSWLSFFYGKGDGSGTAPHEDPVCEAIISTQIHARKRWRLALPGNLDNGGMVDPMFDFVMTPGDTLYFPVGMVHETYNEPPFVECSSSVSMQFVEPVPIAYISALPRHLTRSLARTCLYEAPYAWNHFIFGHQQPRDTSEAYAEETFGEFDTDRDGFISADEAKNRYHNENYAYLSAGTTDGERAQTNYGVSSKVTPEQRRTDVLKWFMLFHDKDEDGVVSKSEFLLSLSMLGDLKREFKGATKKHRELMRQLEREEEKVARGESIDMDSDDDYQTGDGESYDDEDSFPADSYEMHEDL